MLFWSDLSLALKHYTSKLERYLDLNSIRTFGFRGEALSFLYALKEEVSICTATSETAPVGVFLIMDSSGRVKRRSTVAQKRRSLWPPSSCSFLTLSERGDNNLPHLFTPLAVRRKEFERNGKREFGKALSVLNAYAWGPCAATIAIRLIASN